MYDKLHIFPNAPIFRHIHGQGTFEPGSISDIENFYQTRFKVAFTGGRLNLVQNT